MIGVAYHPCYQHPLPEGHRFPMIKYELIPEQLLREGIIDSNQILTPTLCDTSTLKLTHDFAYITHLAHGTLPASHIRRIGFPWSYSLYERECIICEGTIRCAMHAMQHGAALNIAGGTHHAFRDRGEGFCLMNDVAVAANWLLAKGIVERILIIDLDVHQGNGTAAIFNKMANVYTFSMHGKNNYPFLKEKSDLDVELADGTPDSLYLELLTQSLRHIQSVFKPQFVFYIAGVDVLQTDKLGKLGLTATGCMERDEMVYRYCYTSGIPVVTAMGGGYSPHIQDIVNAHVNTFRIASKWFDH